MSKRAPKTLVVLSTPERQWFFPGALGRQLDAVVPGAVYEDPKSVDFDWEKVLVKHRPEVLVTAWHAPRLPVAGALPRYVCHVTGSVRGLVPRSLIESGVLVSNWGETISDAVAEGALLLILSALRRSHFVADLMHRQKGWKYGPLGARTLFGRRIGIHGFGAVVRHLLPLLRPFGGDIHVFTEGVPPELYAKHGVTAAPSLEALFEWAEVIVEVEAFNDRRRHMVNAGMIARLKPGAVFVNVGRGALVDEAALAAAVACGRIRVGLDVFEQEPLSPESPLRGQLDAVLFPHIAGPTDDGYAACGAAALENLTRYANGDRPNAIVTLEIFDRAT